MKYLSDYTQKNTTQLLDATGAFFAYGRSQFDEQKQDGVDYVAVGYFLMVPRDHEKTLTDGLNKIHTDAIQRDLVENGKEKIIERELYNHECFYTNDISDCVDALEYYDITAYEIGRQFRHLKLTDKQATQ